VNKINGFIQKIKASEFWSSVAKLSAGQIIGQTITLLATLVLSRIYSSADYGSYGIIASTATIIISIIDLAIDSSIMVAKTDDDSRRIFTVSFLIQTTLLCVVCLGMIIISPYKMFFTTTFSYNLSVFLMALYIISNSLYSKMRIYVNRLKKNNILFWNSIINAGCTVLVSIPLGLLNFGFIGLLSTSILAGLLSFFQMLRADNPFKKINGWGEIKQTIIESKNYILYQYPSNVMGNTAANIPNQMLYNSFGDAMLGQYSMCNKIFSMPLKLIATPIQTVYFRTVAQSPNENEKISDFTFGFIKKMMYIAIFPIVLVMTFGENIFSFLLGNQWDEAGLIAAIMCPYFFFYFCYSCITYLRVAIGKQKVNLVTTIIQILSMIIALIFALKIDNTMVVITIFAVVNTLLAIINIEINFVCLKKNAILFVVYSFVFLLICMSSILFRMIL
jgi:O-antigen/teichoic acid export membrane protein